VLLTLKQCRVNSAVVNTAVATAVNVNTAVKPAVNIGDVNIKVGYPKVGYP
jgi:hypothetical protein